MTFIRSEERNIKLPGAKAGRIMVYGSLMTGFFNYEKVLKGQVLSCVPARVKGQLYHMSQKGYPALVSGTGWVYGELMELSDPESTRLLLDQIEHYYGPGDPQNEYERRSSTVENLSTGKTEVAEVYWYVLNDLGTPANPGVEIPGGDWREYMNSVNH